MRADSLKRNYNITLEEYDRLLDEQDGVCAICGGINSNGRRLSVDHDHDTGKIRGLLCGNCNVGIGHLQDDPEVLAAAIGYILKHR